MYAISPNGRPILGTYEMVYARANTIDDSFTKNEDGSLSYDHEGFTEVWWDSQMTIRYDENGGEDHDHGQTVFVDDAGDLWRESQIQLVEEEPA